MQFNFNKLSNLFCLKTNACKAYNFLHFEAHGKGGVIEKVLSPVLSYRSLHMYDIDIIRRIISIESFPIIFPAFVKQNPNKRITSTTIEFKTQIRVIIFSVLGISSLMRQGEKYFQHIINDLITPVK